MTYRTRRSETHPKEIWRAIERLALRMDAEQFAHLVPGFGIAACERRVSAGALCPIPSHLDPEQCFSKDGTVVDERAAQFEKLARLFTCEQCDWIAATERVLGLPFEWEAFTEGDFASGRILEQTSRWFENVACFARNGETDETNTAGDLSSLTILPKLSVLFVRVLPISLAAPTMEVVKP